MTSLFGFLDFFTQFCHIQILLVNFISSNEFVEILLHDSDLHLQELQTNEEFRDSHFELDISCLMN